MLKNRPLSVAAIVAVLGAFVAYSQVDAADAPKVSTFAPAEDLARQADKFIESMKNTVASQEEYNDSEGKIGRDSNTLIVIALALGLHDQESKKYKARAGALMKAAQDVAATKDYASAKKAEDSAGYSAVIAAIAQGSIADTSATKNADQVKLWRKFSMAMRDDAGAVNAAIHKGDAPATAKAMKKLNQSCEDCHDVFKPKEK